MDSELETIKQHLLSLRSFEKRACKIVRQVAEWVIDPIQTGRKTIDELGKAEKTMLGTKFEPAFTKEFGIESGAVFDCLTGEIEWDVKFTSQKTWMIPAECYRIEGICLCARLNENHFSLGLIRASPENITRGMNQDKKKSISKAGRDKMDWLIKDVPVHPRSNKLSILLSLLFK